MPATPIYVCCLWFSLNIPAERYPFRCSCLHVTVLAVPRSCLLPRALPAASVALLLAAWPGREDSFVLLCQANARRGLALCEVWWELCNSFRVSYKGNANNCECTHRGHNSQLRETLCCALLSGSDHSLVRLQCAEWRLPTGTTCLGTQCYKNVKFARLKAWIRESLRKCFGAIQMEIGGVLHKCVIRWLSHHHFNVTKGGFLVLK